MQIKNTLTEALQINFPLIMAPMFLVSNFEMVEAGMQSGIMGTFPSLNFRKEGELDSILQKLNKVKIEKKLSGNFGVNLIVQKSNPLYEKHLAICVQNKVPFYITSLGSPKEVIEKAHSYGAKVYCDVTNIVHAQKCFDLGCDGFIAVGQAAGGHAGPNSLQVLIPSLHKHFPKTPVVAAGGIATGEGLLSVLALGAAGVSVGTRFIASEEAKVNKAYKSAIVDSKMDDIVFTTKISGTPCTIINTPYAKKIGYTQNWFEKLLSNNNTTKKYFKMLVQIRGMQKLERSVKPANYDTLWCAGQSVELIDDILPCAKIIERMQVEMQVAFTLLKTMLQ
jgi:nitronate monooxygenase